MAANLDDEARRRTRARADAIDRLLDNMTPDEDANAEEERRARATRDRIGRLYNQKGKA